MDFKCLKNNIKLHYYPYLNHELVLYIDHPFYMVLFLVIEMYISDYEIAYNFDNNFIIIYKSNNYVDEIIKKISEILSLLLDYYLLELPLYNEIINYVKQIEYFNLINYMFPNYNYVLNYKDINYDMIRKSIKYFFNNSQIYFITSNKKIFNSNDFNLIKKIVKRSQSNNYYLLPYKKFSSLKNDENLLGIYLDKLEYFEHYILDLIVILLENKNFICDLIWISKKFKIMVIPFISINTLNSFSDNISKSNFEIDLDFNKIIKKKIFIDIINFKNFDINIYNRISKNDIINLSQKIFNLNNIKYLKKN